MDDDEVFRFRAEEFENDPGFRWPEQFAESQARLTSLSKPEAKKLHELGEWVNENLVRCQSMGLEPHTAEVQKVVRQHFIWANAVWDLDKVAYLKLSEMYRNEPRYNGYYERISPGLGEYLATAMQSYANSML
ncbi:MAG: TipAS antibiotic-recognition domain-containing protein [Microbacteriaceae bacterium]|nr:TipAS antibiotic-recognition domain-containing protein [Microbacteriaceae bacterium]MDR9443941.1 TipAS antibiotic-recognition domain-containing protein [Microbacteriaceae bacterium]